VRRRLFKSAFLLSIFLCIGLCILCLRSFWIADAWGWSSGKRTIQCGLAAGRLRFDTTLLGQEGGEWPHALLEHVQYKTSIDPPTQRLPATFGNLGFSFERRSQPRNYTSWLVLIPIWAPVLLLLVLVEFFRRQHRRALRDQGMRGLCPYCGYDMRATPTTCPECGH